MTEDAATETTETMCMTPTETAEDSEAEKSITRAMEVGRRRIMRGWVGYDLYQGWGEGVTYYPST